MHGSPTSSIGMMLTPSAYSDYTCLRLSSNRSITFASIVGSDMSTIDVNRGSIIVAATIPLIADSTSARPPLLLLLPISARCRRVRSSNRLPACTRASSRSSIGPWSTAVTSSFFDDSIDGVVALAKANPRCRCDMNARLGLHGLTTSLLHMHLIH